MITNPVCFVFDMDGVIVDTLATLYRNYLDILTLFGKSGSAQEFDRLNGSSLDEIVTHIATHHDLLGSEAAIRSRFEDGFSRLYEAPTLIPGVKQALQNISSAGVPIVIASSAGRETIASVVRYFELENYISGWVSGEDVERGKPCPDIYLKARSLVPGAAIFIAVEDSDNGILSAWQAGMIPVHFVAESANAHKNASFVINDMSTLTHILASPTFPLRAMESTRLTECRAIPVSTALKSKIDQFWQSAVTENPSLFDAQVMCYQGHEMTVDGLCSLRYCRRQYREVFYALRNPDARQYANLPVIIPLAVSGVICNPKGDYLLATRAETVTQYAGKKEFVPSGSMDVPEADENSDGRDLVTDQISRELAEESGIKAIESCRQIGLIYDLHASVMDIACSVSLQEELPVDGGYHSKEYHQYAWLESDAVRRLCHTDDIISTSAELFRLVQQEYPELPEPSFAGERYAD